jgi:hypothetical protein
MAEIKSPFTDAVVKKIPTSPSAHAVTGSEPNLPGDLPGRSGNGIPEVVRDKTTAKVPNWKNAGESFKIGM